MQTVRSLIGGRFREARSEEVQVDPTPDPATGEAIALLRCSRQDQIDEAVRAARWWLAPRFDHTRPEGRGH